MSFQSCQRGCMGRQIRLGIAAVFSIFITACASMVESNRDAKTYHESAFNDLNPAPAQFAPKPISNSEQTTLDPLYMRTQADYYYASAEAFSFEGSRQKAIEAFKMTLVYDADSPTVRLRLAAEYLKSGLISEALEQAQIVTKQNPENVSARMLLGGIYTALKLYPKATEQYELVLKIDPKHLEAPLYLGAVYSELKQYDRSVKYFELLLKNPEYQTPHYIHYYIGRVRVEQGGQPFQKVAEAQFKKALQIKPSFVDAAIALSSLYSKQKKEEQAMSLLHDYQKNQGPHPKVAEILSQYYVENGKYDEAYEQLEILEENADDPLNVKLKMALILIEKKMYTKATAKLEDILKEAPESDKIRFYLAAVYEESRRDEDAIEQFSRIPVTSKFYAESVIHMAYLLRAQGKLEQANDKIEIALKEKKDQPQLYLMHASLLDELKQYQRASDILEKAMQSFPEDVQMRFYFATMQDRLGKKDKLIVEIKKVLEMNPNHVQGLNYLAFTWAEMGTELDKAEELARRAVKLEPEDGYILDTLGWILFKKGKVTESIKYLEVAHKFQPTVSVIAEHLGDAYYKQALIEKALLMYNKALDLETDTKKAEEIKSKISAIDKKAPDRVPASSAHFQD